MQLILHAGIRNLIISHAIQSLPTEAVGLLAGKQSTVELTFPLRNIGLERAFLADPYDQFQAERSIQSKGLDVLAIYHSHPDGCACLSDVDIAMAMPWECVQIVVSLQTKTQTAQLRGHRLVGTSAEKVDLICPEG